MVKDQWRDLHDGDRIALLPGGEIAFRIEAKEQIAAASDDVTPPTSPLRQDPPPSYPMDERKPAIEVSERSTPPSTSNPQALQSDLQTSKPVVPQSADPQASKRTDSAHADSPLDDLLFGDVKPDSDAKETKEEVMAESPPIQPTLESKDTMTIKGKDGAAENQTIPRLKPAGSTGRKRVLPAWLSNLPDKAPSGDGAAVTKRAPAKPKAAAKRKPKESIDQDDDADADLAAPAAKVSTYLDSWILIHTSNKGASEISRNHI